MKKKLVLGLAAVVILGLVGWTAYEMRSPGESPSASSLAEFGHLAQSLTGDMGKFTLSDTATLLPLDKELVGPNGTTTLAAYKGQILLINLWAEWCAPCIEEMPTLAALQKELGGADFHVLPISIDRAPIEQAQAVLGKFNAANLETLSDPKMQLMGDLGFIGLPATVLVDREGREVGRMVGPAKWDGPDAKKLIRALIATGQ